MRRAESADVETVARLNRRVRDVTMPYLPKRHSAEEDLWFFENIVFKELTVWLAEVDRQAVGFAAFRPGWLDHLYILPEFHGRGIGGLLLERAKIDNDRLELWVFQRNLGAIAFYRRHGFRDAERTDGTRNEEGEPDLHMIWDRPKA